ncbi:MAG: IclR family KDG regulon transcriptional repressor [Neolewinella sp.]|jgi:IclR family KDG regulon transcriptional repressor
MKELKNSVHKTFAILEHFTIDKPAWGVTELAKEIGSNKSTVFRFLAQLHSIGILDKDAETEKYSLGLKLFELGNRVQLRRALVEKTHPKLASVAMNITETVHIAVLNKHQVFYIDKVESPQGLKTSSHIGSYNPAYCTALGKVLLAFLPAEQQGAALDFIFDEAGTTAFTKMTITDRPRLLQELAKVRAEKYALDLEELEEGLICIAIPIFNQQQEVVASLSASGPASRFREDKVKGYLTMLSEGALAIQERIGNYSIL